MGGRRIEQPRSAGAPEARDNRLRLAEIAAAHHMSLSAVARVAIGEVLPETVGAIRRARLQALHAE